ncbi:MAG TPA: hypothetical protein VFA91_05575 [Candidatus Polarisedimenticolia bacterium]|nr:hypothetical protein [Candidatus Polarisedimenticolia bacterium]
MSQVLHRAILDTLLPGGAGLPAPGTAGIDLDGHAALVAPIAAMIIAKAGSEQAFIAGEEVQRIALLQSAQQELPDAFASLLAALLPDYYESSAVLQAFGWTARPPQPLGHSIPTMDAATGARLEKVRLRRKLWRDEA